MKRLVFLFFLLSVSAFSSAQFKAGVARKAITPEIPIWLSGYASRNKPADGILHDLWAKALVVEDNKGNRIIIVTMDIIGLSHELSETIIKRVTDKYGMDRSCLLLNASHTHSGPVIWPSLSMMYELGRPDLEALIRYSRMLADDISSVIDSAMLDITPADLFIAHGSAGIAVNRRQPTEKGVIIGVNNGGPVDSDVPVLKVVTPDGKIKSVLFGYACHNTTLDIYQVNGDYAGFAQIEVEKQNPGVTAMFLAGCGADQNPNPRRSVEVAMQHGATLANAVQKVLSGEFTPVHPPIRTARSAADLTFAPVSTDLLKEELLGDNRFKANRARFILGAIDKGYNVNTLSYPVQTVRFGKDFTILGLSGEVVVDYSLKAKKMYQHENLFVAGYCTEVQCYIPSKRVLKEGGYEPETSMIYYGLPGPFTDDVEDKVFRTVNEVMKQAGAGKGKQRTAND